MKIPLLISRLILGGVFAYASFDKILHPSAFAEVVYNYQILPDGFINLTAVLLPWLELWVGLFLISGLFLRGAVFICNLLLAVFFAALAFNLARGLDFDCGCFISSVDLSAGSPMLWYLIRDALFLAIGFYLFYQLCLKKDKTGNPLIDASRSMQAL